MTGSRLNGTRRPKPLRPEQRFAVEQDLREEIVLALLLVH